MPNVSRFWCQVIPHVWIPEGSVVVGLVAVFFVVFHGSLNLRFKQGKVSVEYGGNVKAKTS